MSVVIQKKTLVETDALTELVGRVEKAHVNDLIELITKASDAGEFASLELGGLLCRAEREKVWEKTKHVSFLEWCSQCCGIDPRRSQYLRRAYTAVVESGLNFADFENVGWYKTAVLLARVLEPTPKPNVNGLIDNDLKQDIVKRNAAWLAKAKKLSRSQLAAAIAVPSSDTKAPTPIKQYVFKAQGADQIAAIDAAKEKFESAGYEGAGVLAAMATHVKAAKAPKLESVMSAAGPKAVLVAFEKLWPAEYAKLTTAKKSAPKLELVAKT
jgi:hypothetical protein